MRITLVSGTNRSASTTLKLTKQIAALYNEIGQPVQILDLAELPPELFLPSAYTVKPEGFARFSDAILASDGVHLVVPEYNGGAPGVLKYFIDMLKFPEAFEHRPVAYTGLAAGMWGGLRPVEQLQGVFGYRNAHQYPERVFLAGANQQFGPDGLLTNADTLKRLRSQVGGFLEFVRRLR